jgi:hypothetical protein
VGTKQKKTKHPSVPVCFALLNAQVSWCETQRDSTGGAAIVVGLKAQQKFSVLAVPNTSLERTRER